MGGEDDKVGGEDDKVGGEDDTGGEEDDKVGGEDGRMRTRKTEEEEYEEDTGKRKPRGRQKGKRMA